MKHFFNYDGFTGLYRDIILTLIEYPEYKISPRGLPIRELINVVVELEDPKDHLIDFSKTMAPERQEAYDRYRKAELEWYLSGNTLASSAPSKFWNQLADQDGHITSNYGHMMLFDKSFPLERPFPLLQDTLDEAAGKEIPMQTAVERVVSVLTKDPHSRQAIVFYGQPKHYWPTNKDQPCTLTGQFFIRDNKLSFTVNQRSCDIIKGFSYDVPWQCHLMDIVLEKLKANGMNIELGTFTHVFGSLHLYEKDLELAERIVKTVQ